MKPRILMVIQMFNPKANGAELQAERLGGKLVGLGHEVGVLTNLVDPNSSREEIIRGIHVQRMDLSLPFRIFGDNAGMFRDLVRNRRCFDIIHSHQAFGHAVVATVFARWFGKKSIVKIACADSFGDFSVLSQFSGFRQAIWILRQANAIIAISREVEKELLLLNFDPSKIKYIPNGVDCDEFKRSSPTPRRKRVRFILIGRRTPQKGIDTALEAMRILADRNLADSIELHLHGDDYPEYDFKPMVASLGVEKMVSFRPYVTSIQDVFQKADCLILPSRGEGLSNVLLEAMAYEMPVIASRVSGSIDLVTDGENGLLIDPESPKALADAMAMVISDQKMACALASAARRHVIENFSLDAIAKRYSDLYYEL